MVNVTKRKERCLFKAELTFVVIWAIIIWGMLALSCKPKEPEPKLMWIYKGWTCQQVKEIYGEPTYIGVEPLDSDMIETSWIYVYSDELAEGFIFNEKRVCTGAIRATLSWFGPKIKEAL